MELNNFQYTAPSNSSTAYFPNNKANKFQVKVPHPITLAGEWEVYLVDIQYHSAWLTLKQPQHFILWMLPEDVKIFNLINDEAGDSKDYYLSDRQSAVSAKDVQWSTQTYKPFNSIHRLSTIIALPAGDYDSISDFVSSLNQEIMMFCSRRHCPAKVQKHKDIDLSFHYNSITKQVHLTHIGFKAIQLVSVESLTLANLGFIVSIPINTRQSMNMTKIGCIMCSTEQNLAHPNCKRKLTITLCISIPTSYNIKTLDIGKHNFLLLCRFEQNMEAKSIGSSNLHSIYR